MRLPHAIPLLVMLATLAGVAGADAQTPNDSTTAPSEQVPQGGPKTGSAVIKPPAGVDPGINKAAPNAAVTEPMPVVPAPGTAGGDPKVVPK